MKDCKCNDNGGIFVFEIDTNTYSQPLKLINKCGNCVKQGIIRQIQFYVGGNKNTGQLAHITISEVNKITSFKQVIYNRYEIVINEFQTLNPFIPFCLKQADEIYLHIEMANPKAIEKVFARISGVV